MSSTVIKSRERRYRIVDLEALGTARLPVVHRILLENLLRRGGGDPDIIAGRLTTGASTAEIPFWPTRIMMHDTTCGPALVKLPPESGRTSGRERGCPEGKIPV